MTAGSGHLKLRGFTLIELLVTMAVLVIIATIAIPNFQAFIASNRQASEYNKILSGFHYARSEAVKSRAEINVVIDGESGGWVLNVYNDGVSLRTLQASNGGLAVGDIDMGFNRLGRLAFCNDGSGSEVSPCKVSVGGAAIEVNAAGNISRSESG